ncbi:MAG: aminotransferase class V-fold PLP-dependent enzyme [Candidatus Izemoplasmataceae bacterium]
MRLLDLKKDFPVFKTKDLVYLDTAASSLTPKTVISTMTDYYETMPVNVHRGVYELSHKATEAYEQSREKIARFIGADFEEVIFTRGASSALNMLARMYETNIDAGDEIIVSELEHHSHLLPWQQLARRKGAKLRYVPLTEAGRITTENFKSVLSDKTKVVALTGVSNVLGYKTPLSKIIPLAHEKGAIVSVDAAQMAPHEVIDVRALDCDFLAFSGHKMLGPTGIGVLYGKKSLLDRLEPLEYGGDMVDIAELHDASWKDTPYKFETGTPPIAEVIGLGAAVDYLNAIGMPAIIAHEQTLHAYTMEQLSKLEGITVYNPTCETGIITFNIDGVHPHDAVTFFDEDNVALRAGHHCAQPVMRFLDVIATLRASMYLYNSKSDADRFIDSIKRARDFFTSVGF